MRSSSSGAPSRRIQKRRRIAFSAGLATTLATAAAAVALGTGCIFDEGDYQGGGRRTGAPTSTDTTVVGAPGTPTPSATASSTAGDSGTPDADTPDD